MISPTKEDMQLILCDQQINEFPLPNPQKASSVLFGKEYLKRQY